MAEEDISSYLEVKKHRQPSRTHQVRRAKTRTREITVIPIKEPPVVEKPIRIYIIRAAAYGRLCRKKDVKLYAISL